MTSSLSKDNGSDTLDALAGYAEKHDDQALSYQILFSKNYIKDIEYNTKHIEWVLNKIESTEKEEYIIEAADGYYTLSAWCNNNGQKAKAIEYGLLGYELSKGFSTGQFPPKRVYQHQLALRYYHFLEYKKAKELILQFKETEPGSLYSSIGSAINTLALAYRQLEQYDSAIYYFDQLYTDKEHKLPIAARAIAAGNTGSIYFYQQNYANALIWLKRELNLWRLETGEATSNSCFGTYNFIADIYRITGDVRMANIYIDTAKMLRPSISNDHHLGNYYRTYVDILKKEGKLPEAMKYMDSILTIKERIAKQTNLSKVLAAEKRVEASKHELELAKMNSLKQKSIWVRNSIIILIIFISIVLVLLINRNRLRHIQKELLLENEKNKAQADLLIFTKKLQDRNRELIALQQERAKLTDQQDIAAQNELVYQLQQSTILTDEEWADFRNMFEQVHSGYIARVKATYPEVTPAEIRYMVLVMLDMNTKEIANVLGISTATVRNQRHRMRKKFNVAEEETLETFIKNL